jgi:hypothetical protein
MSGSLTAEECGFLDEEYGAWVEGQCSLTLFDANFPPARRGFHKSFIVPATIQLQARYRDGEPLSLTDRNEIAMYCEARHRWPTGNRSVYCFECAFASTNVTQG